MRHNDVPEILFPKSVLATAGTDVTALAVGQLGFFSEKTGKSLVTTDPLVEPFFIAVGLDTDGDNVTDDIRKSAGPNIQPDNFVYLTRDEYKASQNQVIQITDLKLFCGNSGGVKIELENSQTQFVLGNTAYRKTLVAKTVDCDKCGADGCVPADTAKFVQDLLLIANFENDDFFKIEAINDSGTVLDEEGLQTIVDANAALTDPTTFAKVGLQITTIPTGIVKHANVNLDYSTTRETKALVTLVGDLEGRAKVVETQPIQFEQNSGYDIQEIEYQTIGYRGGAETAYRIGSIYGLPYEVEYETNPKGKYTLITLAYDHYSRTGSWLQYDKALATMFAFDEADKAVADTLETALKNVFSGLGAKDKDGVVAPGTP